MGEAIHTNLTFDRLGFTGSLESQLPDLAANSLVCCGSTSYSLSALPIQAFNKLFLFLTPLSLFSPTTNTPRRSTRSTLAGMMSGNYPLPTDPTYDPHLSRMVPQVDNPQDYNRQVDNARNDNPPDENSQATNGAKRPWLPSRAHDDQP